MEWMASTLKSFHFCPYVNVNFVCVRSFVDGLLCKEGRKSGSMLLYCIIYYLGDPMNTFNMSRRKMSWKDFFFMLACKCVSICSSNQQQAAAAFRKMCHSSGVQEHLVFHGNRVNRKLNISMRRAFSVVI